MKKSVRFLALALSAAMLFGLTACGGGKDDSQPQEAPGTEESGAAEDAGAENDGCRCFQSGCNRTSAWNYGK